MIVRIGVSDTPKEIELDMADDTLDGVKAEVEAAITTGGGVLWLTDRDGRQVGVPAVRVAYIDLGETGKAPKIGFGA